MATASTLLRALPLLGLAIAAPLLHAGDFPLVQLVDRHGAPVPDAVVIAKSAAPAPTASGSAAAIMDQKNKRFVPHVAVVRPGTRVRFPNSDDTRHHVYSFSEAKTFELKLYRANEASPVRFDTPGVVAMGCNIHDNMKGYLYVTDAPVVAVSDERGEVRLPLAADARPDSLRVWHPQLKEIREIDVPENPEYGDAWQIRLPMAWEPPQEGKTEKELENRFKRFKRNAP